MDKRSKQWKSMTPKEQEAYTASLTKPKKSEGLGDTIEKITEATGIKKLVKTLFGEDCGCDERKKKLNKLWSYRTNIECLEEAEYNYLKGFFARVGSSIGNADQIKVLQIYNRVFNDKQPATQCSSCWRGILQKVRKVFDEYEKELKE